MIHTYMIQIIKKYVHDTYMIRNYIKYRQKKRGDPKIAPIWLLSIATITSILKPYGLKSAILRL